MASCSVQKRFRGGLVFNSHRLVYHSTLGLRVIKKKERRRCCFTAKALSCCTSKVNSESPAGCREMWNTISTTTSQKCAAVPRRARIQGSKTCISLNYRLESKKEERRTIRQSCPESGLRPFSGECHFRCSHFARRGTLLLSSLCITDSTVQGYLAHKKQRRPRTLQ